MEYQNWRLLFDCCLDFRMDPGVSRRRHGGPLRFWPIHAQTRWRCAIKTESLRLPGNDCAYAENLAAWQIKRLHAGQGQFL